MESSATAVTDVPLAYPPVSLACCCALPEGVPGIVEAGVVTATDLTRKEYCAYIYVE